MKSRWNVLAWRKHWHSAVLTACLLAAGTLSAQHNYQGYPLGDRASGMGGAVVASANSVDACYYNPAGLSRLQHNTISLSGSLYGRQTYRGDEGLYTGEDIRYDSFITIPTTVGGLWKLPEEGALGFAVFVPHRLSYNEMRSFRNNEHVYNYNTDDQTLWLGPSIGWKITPELSLGASVYAVYRSFNEFVSVMYREVNAGYARGRSFNDWGALGSVGAQYQATENLRLGLLAQSPSFHVWGRGAYQENLVTQDETENIYLDETETDNHTPAQIRLGVAWEQQRAYTLEMDISYYFGQDYDLQSWENGEESRRLRIRRNDVINFNLGAEYFLFGTYPLRAGFFTDFSAAPAVSPYDVDNAPKIDSYGFSASIGKQVAHMSANFGLVYVFGTGDGLGWTIGEQEPELNVTGARAENIYLMVNTAYLF